DARTSMLEAGGIAGGKSIDRDALAKLHKATGADVLVGGDLETAGDTLRANIELHDAARGKRIGTLTLSAPAGDINAFVREASARVRRKLARPALSIEDETALRSILPENPEASLAYVEGLAARRAFRYREAAAHFERVNQLAPTFAPAFSSLAHARLMLGHQKAATEAANQAVKLAPSLPRGDELLVYALAAETRHDWPAAVENYRALAQFYPERADYVTSLARALTSGGKAKEAIVLLDQAKARPQSDWDLVRIHLQESFAHSRSSNDVASLATAKEAERLAVAIGARVPMADAILSQGHKHHRAGRLDEATALFNRARAIYADVGDTDNILNCDTALAEIASVRGDYARAITIGERIVEAHKESGNLYRRARVTTALCIFNSAAGQLSKARTLCEQGGQLYKQAGDQSGEGWGLLNLAELDMRLGRLDGTLDKLARGRAIHAEIGHKTGVAAADSTRAQLAWVGGKLAEAATGLDAAFTEATAAGEAGLKAEIALHRARVAFARKVPEEPARFDEAEKLVAASSDTRLMALLAVHAARRALAKNDLAEARRRALAADEHARKAHAGDAIALALAVSLDVFAGEPGPAQSERRAELASRVDKLEAIEPKVEALLALSRAETGPRSKELATHAAQVARDGHYVLLEKLALRSN
ncbi:MAG TPA: hypothetical protein VIU61_15015, partial [Kofleriaceae bacterium]